MKYIFGPVKSRRLGISLGVDITPYKTCTMDCVYCECGKTTDLTTSLIRSITPEDVIDELNSYLSKKPVLDNITFSGAGEPTLNPGIKKIITFLKKNYPEYNVTVLTNGSLVYVKNIRNKIINADIIIPSLDAVSPDIFKKIARPAKNISAEKVIKGIISLRKEFKGKIFLEVFIIPGLNDTENEIDNIKKACLKIKPDAIQLNKLDRPGTEDWVAPASAETLDRIKKQLAPFRVDIPALINNKKNRTDAGHDDLTASIMNTITRRPSTIEDLSSALDTKISELSEIIEKLLIEKKILKIITKEGTFYRGGR
ncbi:MAG: radical SAM protein [Spirochaetes bacterium]|nr:radical SAM protein [Spirochaetota bacterium]